MSIQHISSRHEAIMLSLLSGTRPGDICETFGLTPSHLSILRSSNLWKQKESELKQELLKNHAARLDSLREKAISALDECVMSIDEGIKLKSAREILDRTGLIAGFRLEGTVSPTINMYIPPGWNLPTSSESEEESETFGGSLSSDLQSLETDLDSEKKEKNGIP